MDAAVQDVGLGNPASQGFQARLQFGSHAAFDRRAGKQGSQLSQSHPRHKTVGVRQIAANSLDIGE
ncbi:MAG: hypothetical protein ACT4OP_05355, partial [Actinomycetota bacterium]